VSLTPSADAADVAAATARRHLLNGDGHLGPAQRVAYLLLNARRNRLPYSHVDSELTIVDFHCAMALERLDELPGTPSPSRALSDLFWMHLPWQRMVRELGPLHVLDLGCGSGQYGERLPRWSEGRIVRYVGVDLEAHRDWPRLVSNRSSVEFHAGNIEDIDRLMPADTNVIVSQSAMEHVTNDMRVFEHVHAYAHRAGRPLLQIHLLPSAACLWLYLWHGYRQYTPRRLTPITTLFATARSVCSCGSGDQPATRFIFGGSRGRCWSAGRSIPEICKRLNIAACSRKQSPRTCADLNSRLPSTRCSFSQTSSTRR